MTLLRCRHYGDPEWTEISIEGPAERAAFSACGAGLASGNLAVQYRDGEEWIDLSELEWDDEEPEE